MASYQKDTNNGVYEPINGNGVHPSDKSGKSKKWLITGIILAILGAILVGAIRKPAGASTKDAIKKSGLPLNEDGSLLLFDKLSK